jgi:U3 small nucleolar ribonucleoprotein component
MRKVKKFDEGPDTSAGYEINKAIKDASKFLSTKYGTEETNEKIVRDIADGIYYGIQNMSVSQEDKEAIYTKIIDRLERMVP